MDHPKLINSRVVIEFECDDGYDKSSTYTNDRADGKKIPHNALMTALDDLARITALYGFEDEALNVFNSARARVKECKVRDGVPENMGSV